LAIWIILHEYLRVDVKPPGETPITPLEFAHACVALEPYLPSGFQNAVLRNKHLTQLQRDADATTSITSDNYSVTLQEKLGQLKLIEGGRNDALRSWIIKQPNSAQFLPEYVHHFCRKYQDVVRAEVINLLGCQEADLSFGGPKTPERIAQKLAEYSEHALTSGAHVLKRFKDLFRASIEIKALLAAQEPWGWKDLVVSKKPPADSNFKVYYIILNVPVMDELSMNFELQVVNSLQTHSTSHAWYELKRHSCWNNLLSFIKREICQVPTNDPTSSQHEPN